MEQQLKGEITEEKLILRDFLAADRTALANERTFLAYIRTSFTLVLAGITILKFFNTFTMHVVAGFSIISGLVIILWGIERYNIVQMSIRKAKGEQNIQNMIISFSYFKNVTAYLFTRNRQK